MTPTETAKVCAFIASRCPQQRFEESTPDAWHADLKDRRYVDALEAARRCTKARPFVSLSELLEAMRLIGNERATAKETKALEASKGDRKMPAGFEDTFKRVPLEEPGAAFPHREALRHPCAYCGAQPGRACTVAGKDRRTPHPLRGAPDQASNPTGVAS